MTMGLGRPAAALLIVGALLFAGRAGAAPSAAEIAARLDAGLDRLPAGVAEAPIAAVYRARGYSPLWLAGDGRAAERLLTRLQKAAAEGLRPDDYRPEALRAALAGAPESVDAAALELRLSAQFLHYARDLRLGRVRPGAVDAGVPEPAEAPTAEALLTGAAAAPDLARFLRELAPANPRYRALRGARADLRAVVADGGWPRLEPGDKLEAGMRGPRVAALRARLRAGGDLTGPPAAEPELFGARLDAAVRRVQRRHGLVVDGIVGRNTFAALNVPAADRLAQIEVNLERWRWMPDDLGARYVLVNLAGFEARLVSDGRVELDMRAVVGKPYRKSPVFSDRITYLEFNPTWTVPPTILRQDILPKLRDEPGYLAANEMALYAGWAADAEALDPAEIDWAAVEAKRFPYRIVQAPGPGNPLGRVKFMFPNRHHVYLHDSPERALFDRPSRAFSSGCIRIDQAAALATALLAGKPGWDAARVEGAMASGEPRIVRLPEPVAIHLTYATAWVADDGALQFRPDIYGRDRALSRALADRPSP